MGSQTSGDQVLTYEVVGFPGYEFQSARVWSVFAEDNREVVVFCGLLTVEDQSGLIEETILVPELGHLKRGNTNSYGNVLTQNTALNPLTKLF